jgi:hypothetical protein
MQLRRGALVATTRRSCRYAQTTKSNGIGWAAKYGLDLEKLATKYEADWQLWQSTNNKGSEE